MKLTTLSTLMMATIGFLTPCTSMQIDDNRLEKLPDEVMCHVLSFLNSQDLANASLVDNRLHNLSKDEHLWKNLYKNEISDSQTPEQDQTWKSLYAQAKEGIPVTFSFVNKRGDFYNPQTCTSHQGRAIENITAIFPNGQSCELSISNSDSEETYTLRFANGQKYESNVSDLENPDTFPVKDYFRISPLLIEENSCKIIIKTPMHSIWESDISKNNLELEGSCLEALIYNYTYNTMSLIYKSGKISKL